MISRPSAPPVRVPWGAPELVASGPRGQRIERHPALLRIHAKDIAWIGYASTVLMLVAATTVPWMELVFPLRLRLVRASLLVHSYRMEQVAADR